MKLALTLALAMTFVVAIQAQEMQNAALIIGGYWYYDDGAPIKDKVELFCPGAGASAQVSDFPEPTYLAGGVLYQDGENVLVCGGYGCDQNDVCSTKTNCYWWNPTNNNNWSPAPSLLEPRFNYLMASAYHIDFSGQGLLPLSLGYGYDTEIFNKRDNEWQSYFQLDDRNWYAQGCLIDYNEKIYSMRDKIVELDPKTWVTSDIHILPDELIRSGKCTGLTLGDHPGIFSRYGYWYDLTANNWTKKAAPPVEPISGATNVMFSLNGKPTIFGHPNCNDVGQCDNKLIMQYNPETDSWAQIGEMLQSRIYQTVIEVPASWCDTLGVTTTPETVTSTTEGGTTAGASTAAGSLAVMISAAFFLFFKH